MSKSSRARSACALVLGCLLALATNGQPANAGPVLDSAGPAVSTGPGTYLVTLAESPSASYDGGLPGFPATRPREGHRFDRTRPAVVRYTERLIAGQDAVLAGIGHPAVLYRFTTALDGFAVRLSGAQVKTLTADPRVAAVERSVRVHVDGTHAPDFLGLEGAGGAWADHGGPERAGRHVVVGVIDTGIWPENPSFAGLPQRTPGVSAALPGFHGACRASAQWSAGDCNDKVVSARYFVRGFGRDNVARSEYLSPRDGSGHGSHTASTAAGNHGVSVTIEGQDLGRSSGMAPAASIAAYKACWAAPNPDDDGCSTADTVAAIDQAVADGVDVINYSLSGSPTVFDSVERAFLNAATAGVFVAASAGNGGPQPGSVAHPSPWVTTVAASTHRLFQGSVVLGDGEEYVGAMVSDKPVAETGLVLAAEAAADGSTAEDARLCRVGALDAARVQGKIVVCDRGATARVTKSTAVSRAGGVGMVLANTEPASTDADFHDVPTVHVDVTDAAKIKSYLAAEQQHATASIDPEGSQAVPVPQIAAFSARGPAPAPAADLLKPDLTAPGVSVVGAVAPPSDSGRLWDVYSGTSMSAPHVAGLAAFIKGVHPAWSPARIKSAMMTTAGDLQGAAEPFGQGAGQVDPRRFLDPGLVFDSGPRAWREFLAGSRTGSQLNLPSAAVADLTGTTTLTRRVTNVSAKSETYSADVSGLDGIDVQVRPSTLTLAPGQSRRFTLRFVTGKGATPGHYAQGWLTWTGLTHQVRTPLVVQPQPVATPAELTGSGSTATLPVRGTIGTDAPLELSSTGLAPASPTGISLVPGGFDPSSPKADADAFATTISVPPGTDVARAQLVPDNRADDVDLFVYQGADLVASSTSGGAEETVTLVAPAAGEYTVYANAAAAENGTTTTGQLFTWVVGERGGSPLTLSPSTVAGVPGKPFDFTVGWDDLDPTQRWFGAVRYGDSGIRTLVSVSP